MKKSLRNYRLFFHRMGLLFLLDAALFDVQRPGLDRTHSEHCAS